MKSLVLALSWMPVLWAQSDCTQPGEWTFVQLVTATAFIGCHIHYIQITPGIILFTL